MIDSRNMAVFTLGELRKQLEMLPDSTVVGVLPEGAGEDIEDIGALRTAFIQLVRAKVLVFRTAPRAASILFDAVSRDDREGVSKLIAEGADVDGPDPRNPFFDGETPLILAANAGLVEMTRLLVKLGANVNARSASGWTALMRACNAGDIETARTLLEAGACATLVNDEGYTARGRCPGNNVALVTLLAEWETVQQGNGA